jgi:hypothetical protein
VSEGGGKDAEEMSKFFSIGTNRLFIFLLIFIHVPLSFLIYQKDIELEKPRIEGVLRFIPTNMLELMKVERIVLDEKRARSQHTEFDIARETNFRFPSIFIDSSLKSSTDGGDAEFFRNQFVTAYASAREELHTRFTVMYLLGSMGYSWFFSEEERSITFLTHRRITGADSNSKSPSNLSYPDPLIP